MSNVTPLEIAGIVARAFDLSMRDLKARHFGRWLTWPEPLKARAVAVLLIRAHTTARLVEIAALFDLAQNDIRRRLDEADERLANERRNDPRLAARIVACEDVIDGLHEARDEARDKALADLDRRMAGAGADAKWASEAPKQGVRP